MNSGKGLAPLGADPLNRYAAIVRLEREQAALLATICREEGWDLKSKRDELSIATAGGDAAKLRGIPAIGRNVQGCVRGTDPLGELIRREAAA